ncbi:MAG TPA: hypothetical protein VLY23_14625 [Candidatus Acidoferrum sp.]|nr:hypothetical protein [Candidatus Acidoferrum sp.]
MVNENRQAPLSGTFSATSAMMVAAALLILLGIVFQLGELGYGHLQNLWFVSMLTQDVWNLVALHTSGELEDVFRFWPVALVSMGLALLMLQRGTR